MAKYDLYKTETGLLVAVDEKGNMVYGTTAIDLSKKQKPKQMDYSQITNLANKRKTSSTKKTEQVNIGTENAPLMVPKGSPAHKNWLEKKMRTTEEQIQEKKGIVEKAQELGYEPTEDIKIGDEGEVLAPKDEEGEEGGGGTPPTVTGNEILDELLNKLDDALTSMIDAGQTINPKIELTPDTIQGFLDQATEEISPYYAEQIGSIKDRLSENINYLQEAYQLEKEQEKEKFLQSLTGIGEEAAEAGLAYSGKRKEAEEKLRTGTERSLSARGLELEQQLRGLTRTSAETAGSSALAGLDLPTFKTPEVEGVTAGRRLDFAPPTGITGSLQRERLTAEQQRAAELEEAERKKRALNYYNV